MTANGILKNYFYNVIYQILVIIIPLITTPYISRVLGVENVGIYSYVSTVSAYFVTFSQLGLNLYGRRQISYIRADRKNTSNTFKQLMLIRFTAFGIGLLCYFLLLLKDGRYTSYYQIFILYIMAGAVDITWFFQAFEEFKIITVRNCFIKIINVAGIFLFVRTRNDLWRYMVIFCAGEFVSQAAMWTGIKKKIEFKGFEKDGIWDHIKGSAVMFLPQIITTVYTLADKLILGILSTETQVGLYSQSEKIVKLSLALIGSMGTAAMPQIANCFVNGEELHIRETLSKNLRLVCFLAFPMIFGLYGIADSFTLCFFGPGYEAVSYLMVMISPIILLIGLSDLYGMQYLVPTGHMREYTIAAAAGAAANVILNLILVGKYAAVGVSIATVASELVVAGIMRYYAGKYITLRVEKILRYPIIAVFLGIIVKVIDIKNNDNVYMTAAEIMIGASLYIIALWVLRDELVMEFIKMIKARITGRKRERR